LASRVARSSNGPNGTQRHHVYAVVVGTPSHRDHIDFRDYLRANPDEVRAYAELKNTLLEKRRRSCRVFGGEV
jgi:GrpB-like predicted nucleotidyltransferase (UPF0157 family)